MSSTLQVQAAFCPAGALTQRWVNAVSPSHFHDESAAADLFGPDEGFADDDDEPLPAVASRDVAGVGEVRLDSDDNVGRS